ncbi:MAG TPA: 3,4-dihydroxy-2-butanone-4-phosphate synthase [Devosiaceae bacterium]|nr:3,4-dihydroxy-2-butanone-4-phosphate synthase [Devosiaceae bacterium]
MSANRNEDYPPMTLDSVESAIAAIAAGELVVVVDDTDRENEGDLIMAASKATPEQIAFMIRHTSGILCVPMPAARAQALHLEPMVANNIDPFRTAFTVSVDYKLGMTTGIAAQERTNTIRALAGGNAGAADFIRPGHIFPLIAREGGVLARSGHTEAGVDLATLAGLEPAGVLAEVVNDDGTVKRLPELVAFAREHGLKIVSIEDLIAYRLHHESFLKRVAVVPAVVSELNAEAYAYETPFDPLQQVALVIGEVDGKENVPVRLYREQPLRDLMARANGEGDLMAAAVAEIKARGRAGVLIMLRNAHALDAASDSKKTPQRLESGPVGGEKHESALARMQRWREVGVGAQILRDLGVRSIALMTSQPRQYVGLGGFGIAINETIVLK